MFTPRRPDYRGSIQFRDKNGVWQKAAKDLLIWNKDPNTDNPNGPDIHSARFTIAGVEYTLSAWREQK